MTLQEWLRSVGHDQVYVPDGRGGYESEPTDTWLADYLSSDVVPHGDSAIVVPDMVACDHSVLRVDHHDTGSDLYLTLCD